MKLSVNFKGLLTLRQAQSIALYILQPVYQGGVEAKVPASRRICQC